MTEFISADLVHIKELSLYGISRAAVAIGVFDGVHLGHQKLLTELLTISSELNAEPVVMTFFPHPRSILTEHPPRLLYPKEEKIRLLHSYGVKAVVTVHFTGQFSRLSPDEFLEQSVFAGPVPIAGICVGRHWKFGARAAGNADFLEWTAQRMNFRFSAVDELCMKDGQAVSSTAIRNAIASGELGKAENMLGRRYSLFGTVIPGYRNAGKELDAPTANLQMQEGVLPPNGVYAGVAHLPAGERCAAAVNIGTSPTFREQYGRIDPRVEVHLLDFHGDLYGQKIKLELAGFVREEKQFPDVRALKEQIARDIGDIRKIVKRPERS